MEGVAVGVIRRFRKRLTHGGMGENQGAQFLRPNFLTHERQNGCDVLHRIVTHCVYSQKRMILLAPDHFHKSGSLPHHPGFSETRQGKPAYRDLLSALTTLFFGQTHRSDFRKAVHGERDRTG